MRHPKTIILVVLVCIICTSCNSVETSVHTSNTSMSCKNSQSSYVFENTEPITPSNSTNINTYTESYFDNEAVELLTPYFSNRNIESINKDWSENEVLLAWNMTEASTVYNQYTDRMFIDINNDNSFELLLTSYSTNKMYFFKKNNEGIELMDELDDIDVNNGYLITPPTSEEAISSNEVYDFKDNHFFKLYNFNGDIYIMGISWRSALGKTCWIKKLQVIDDYITFCDVFRWGLFVVDNSPAVNFEYRKYDKNSDYLCSTQQEIKEFITRLS